MIDDEIRTAEETITEAIDGAEEVRDPLEGLVEKTRRDPGAPFTPEVLERLAALKQDNRAAFEKLRAELKAICRVTALDKALAEGSGEAGDGRGSPQADILINIAQAAELFHTSDRVGFADLNIGQRSDCVPLTPIAIGASDIHQFDAGRLIGRNAVPRKRSASIIGSRITVSDGAIRSAAATTTGAVTRFGPWAGNASRNAPRPLVAMLASTAAAMSIFQPGSPNRPALQSLAVS